MDSRTEQNFIKALTDYLDEQPGRTLLVSTHRRSLLKLAQRVMVLEDGTLRGDGPREQLIAKSSGDDAPNGREEATELKSKPKKKQPARSAKPDSLILSN